MDKTSSGKYWNVILVTLFCFILLFISHWAGDTAYYGYLYTGAGDFTVFKLDLANHSNTLFILPEAMFNQGQLMTKIMGFRVKETLSGSDFATIAEAFDQDKSVQLRLTKIVNHNSQLSFITESPKVIVSSPLKATFAGKIQKSKITGHIRVDDIKNSSLEDGYLEFRQIK